MLEVSELRHITRFVNTLEVDSGRDGIAAWFADQGVPAAPTELDWAADVREALRALLRAHNGIEVDVEAAARTLDDAARRARLGVRFDGSRPRVVSGADGVEGLVGELLAVAATAAAEGTWVRLKACRAEDCQEAFYDAARNRSRAWCSMAVCGNRAKARAYRQRN
jgi:predicted RNA-binding Zn ribbon-like protein